jgi:hypothetical protein
MFGVVLDDVTETRLRKIAEELGLGLPEKATKAEVVRAIKERVSPDKALILKPDELKTRWTFTNVMAVIGVGLTSTAVVISAAHLGVGGPPPKDRP